MRIIIEDGLAIGWLVHSFKSGELSACVFVKSTYQLRDGAEPILVAEPEPVSGDKNRDDDTTKSLSYPSDFAPFKPRADILVMATGYAPGKRPVSRLPVRMKVGSVDKTLTLFGPRIWKGGILGRADASEPQSFVSLPISYENAFGGPTSKWNPVGRGIDSEDLPQIEDPRKLVTKSRDNIEPAGFGPLSAGWQPRSDMVGKYDERWLKQRWPWPPESFDYAYFNSAPRDQQVDGYLKGDESLFFENLHPEHANYRGRLPARRARCFLQDKDANDRPIFREVSLNLDTLWIDLNAEKMVLVWRGRAAVQTVKMKEVAQILAWTEPLSEPPRPTTYCPVFISDRKRIEDAEFVFESPEEAAGKAEFGKAFAEFDQEIASAEKEIDEAAAVAEQQWAAEKSALVASGIDPALLEPKASSQSIAASAASLRAEIQDQQGLSQEHAAAIQKDLAEVEKLDAEFAAMDEEFAADFPPDPTRDDILAAIAARESLAERDLAELDLAGQDLSGLDCRQAIFRKANLKGANLRKANFAEADLTEADLSEADVTDANLDGAYLTGTILVGAKLAGLSLEGTNLSGLNLAGADLTGSFGKNADFSRADVSKAKLIGVKLPAADFSKAKLEGADFRYAEIPRVDLTGAKAAGINLEGADLTAARASSGADFTGGNFKQAKAAGSVFAEGILDRANFSRANLARAQFSNASLQKAVFDRADLSSASFDDAVLRGAVLTHANLIRAGFDRADLTEADLKGSNLYEAGFWEALLDRADTRNANLKGTTLA
jgi:uncharacterized protein YjbI with pentapeptide repeats